MLGVENGSDATARTVRIIHPKLFDSITYSVGAKKKFLLDDKNRRAYEIHTSTRKDSVSANANKK